MSSFAILIIVLAATFASGAPANDKAFDFSISGVGQFIKYQRPITQLPVLSTPPNLNTHTRVTVTKKNGVASGTIFLNSQNNGDNAGDAYLEDWQVNVDCASLYSGSGYKDVLMSGVFKGGRISFAGAGSPVGQTSVMEQEYFGILRFWDDGSVERSDWMSEAETCNKMNGRSPTYAILPIEVLTENGFAPYVSSATDAQVAFDDCASSEKFLVSKNAFPRCDMKGLYEQLETTINIQTDVGPSKRILDRVVPVASFAGPYGASLKLTVKKQKD